MGQTGDILLWKTFILRKRCWLMTLLELIIPTLLFWLVVHFKQYIPSGKGTIICDSDPKKYNDLDLDTFKLAYTPSNAVTDILMNTVFNRLNDSDYLVTMVSKSSEYEVVEWLRQQMLLESNTSIPYFSGLTQFSSAGVGIIFSNTNDPANLEYTLRTTKGNLETTDNTRYGEQGGYDDIYYKSSGFTTVQAAIDQAYLFIFHQIFVPKNIFIEYLPREDFMMMIDLTLLLPYIITFGFCFIMPSLLRGVIDEKTSGMKEMMRIMGLQPWHSWLHWVVYSLTVNLPVTLLVSLFLTSNSGGLPSVNINFFILWILLILFLLAFIALIFTFSTLFTNGTIALIVGLIMWFVVSIMLNNVFVSKSDQFTLGVNLLTCLWPTVALQWCINAINNFQRNGSQWTVKDLFDDGAGGDRVSVGLAVIMLCVDILVFTLLTWYLDNVRPGPYGRAKPLTFILPCFKKEYNSTSSPVVKSHHRNFEHPPHNANVGMIIENLRKVFNNRVVAVENVDLDIYEGNITALLGHNGAGKSTTMSILSGLFSPTSGKVIVDGKNIFDNMDEFRSSLGLCPQHNLLFTFLTVLEHLIFFGMLKGLSMRQSEKEGSELLRTLLIDGKKNALVSNISGGMKRKLCLAIALIGKPKVLLLDEPTSGLDPQSRRQVWDVLLGFRGHRTMIITTHFMEEADVLGDRIAIMDHGQVSCYGSAMFLKKLYGTGYHLNISKEQHAPISGITRVVGQYLTNATMKVSSPFLLTFNIKVEEASNFPDLFADLENWRNDLGLTGLGVTCTTLEDVFLRVVEPVKPASINGQETTDYSMDSYKKISGFALIFQQFRALIYIRILTRIRTWFSTLIFIALPTLLMAYTVVRLMNDDYSNYQPQLLISLSSFPAVHVAMSSDIPSVSLLIQQMVNKHNAYYESFPADIELDEYMEGQLNKSLIQYERQMIAGFHANSSYLLAGYSQYFTHSLPLVLNILANLLLQLVQPLSSITVFSHPIAVKSSRDACDISTLAESHAFKFPLHLNILSVGLLILTMSFISFPLKERVSKSKQLQLLTGVPPLLYWLTTFLCDFTFYLITITLMFVMLFIFQDNEILTASGYTGTLALVFILYGFSGITFAYIFSFIAESSVKSSVLFVIINLFTGTIAAMFLAFLGQFDDFDNYIFFLNFNPVFSATSALIHLITVMYINGACIKCGENCKTQDPLQYLQTGFDANNPNGINNFLVFLVIDFAICVAFLTLIEFKVFKKIRNFITQCWIKLGEEDIEEDEDIVVESERVRSSLTERGYVSKMSILRVNDLGKKFSRQVTAVRGVTFQVGKGQCFGLLGVNGAGKTTTFRMLTGDEIPSKGDASIVQYSLRLQKSKFLSQVGYCPQFDAINPLLTGEEMLRVYAQLRGIPSELCDSEVSRLIQIMGLKEYSDRRCGTYSGGNKRKLSTAMALIGRPPVVLLDEPTSGVDPVSRRKMWEVVAQCQSAGQAVVLTSHSMEECEALCSRLTIMVGGRMKCVGSPLYLKHKFGQGYIVKFKLSCWQHMQYAVDAFKQDVARQFVDCTIEDQHVGLLHYHIPDPTIRLSDLFTKLEHLKREHPIIEDYIASDTTLEQVFMSFAKIQTTAL